MGQRERGKTAWKRPRPEWRKAGKREKRWKAGQRARRESVTERLSDRGRSTGGNEVKRCLKWGQNEGYVHWGGCPTQPEASPAGSPLGESAFATEALLSSGTLCFCTYEVFGSSVLRERGESYITGKREQMSLTSSKLSLFFS